MTSPRNPLEEAAAWATPAPPPGGPTPSATRGGFNLEEFIDANLHPRRGPVPWDNRGLKWELEVCPFNPEHTGGAAVVTKGNNGAIGFKCHHNGCADKHWREVREIFDGPKRAGNGADVHSSYPSYPSYPCSEQGSGWPEPAAPAAYHGVVGDFLRLVEPHTEADPAALMVELLVGFGNTLGRSAHFRAEADSHYLNLYAVLVGTTSKARKGTSFGVVKRSISTIDKDWADRRIVGGLASGEGLIWAVRDPTEEQGKSAIKVTDPGEADKRLLVIEPEFARVLQVCERETNTLSAILRQAWDVGDLRTMTKRQTGVATGAHISIVGHITRDELRRALSDTAATNGFANRFLWVCAKRSRLLPDGSTLDLSTLEPVHQQLQQAYSFALTMGELRRDEKARAIWYEVYGQLSEGQPGLLGAVTSRAEAQVMRMAALYAVLDCSPVIRAEHLQAGLAVWNYCEASARYVFGDALGDPVADKILEALRLSQNGLSRTEIYNLFKGRRTSHDVSRGLAALQEQGRVGVSRQDTGGRPTEIWYSQKG